MTIKQLVYTLGYQHGFSFIEFSKRHTGQTPIQLKNASDINPRRFAHTLYGFISRGLHCTKLAVKTNKSCHNNIRTYSMMSGFITF